MSEGICLRCLPPAIPKVGKADLAVGAFLFSSHDVTLHVCLEDNLIGGRQVSSQMHISAKEFYT